MLAFRGFKAGIISLDEPRSIYYSGQVLSGTIQFELDEPLTFAAIKAVYIGQAIVKWSEYETERRSGASRTREVEYFGRDMYFSFEQILYGGSGPTTLPAGSHSIKFSYPIPLSAPSSFKGSMGAVSYKVVAIMEHLDLRRDELSTDFEVIAPLDLNTIQDIKKPTVLEFEEISSCNCFCQDSVINVKIILPVSGYCPGQMMKIKIDSNNDSSMEISKIVFQLVRRERYHSQQPLSTYVTPEEVLGGMVQGPILAHTKRSFTCQMKVPDIIAYNLNNCNIIDIGYFLKVKIKMSGCVDDVQEESELCIGLVPLKETVEGTYVHPLSYLLPQSSLPDPNSMPELPTHMVQNVASPPTETPYQIGFKIPGLPEIVVNPPYPVNDNKVPYQNDFPQPSAPPL